MDVSVATPETLGLVASAAISAVGGLAYAAIDYWNAHKAEDLDVKRMLPTIAYGAVVGVAAAFLSTEIASSPQAAFMAGFLGSVAVGKLIGGFETPTKAEVKAGVKA
jgi:hypothetical protein